MKKLFLVDAYALIFKYYYAFLGRPMRNRAGMNTSVVFGFVKFLRDIQKRERPDLLGVAFDPKGGSFRRDIFPEYKANRSETPEDILLSVPYVKRVLEAMCIPILEVEGYEADDVIGTLSQKGVEAGYDVYMVTPDKDYGQLVRDHCRIYKQRGAEGSIEIVGREAIREKYGIDDPQLVRDILALWGDASDNIPGVPGIGEKSACKLVQEWGTVENILDNVSKIKGKQGEKIAEWADNLRLAKRLTTICLDVPIPFREEDLTVCEPHIDELRGVFAELDFKAFMNDLANLAPPEALPEGPRQEAQTQLAEMARAKSAAAKKAALAGQGNLFGDPVVQMPEVREVPVAELQRPTRCSWRRLRTRLTNIRSSRAPRNCAKSSPRSDGMRSSASTRRPPGSTSSTTASSGCRSPWSLSKRGMSLSKRRTRPNTRRSCGRCSRTSGSPRSARTSSST